MDPNTAMEAATEGAKAATKFEEIILKAFGPHWMRKQADAEAYADGKKLQTIRDNPDMDIVYVAGEMHARKCTQEALSYRAEQRMLTEMIQQEQNIENVLDYATSEVQQMNDVSDTPVDDDWIARFFDIVKSVSNTDMQYVWGKILAGEIKQPGSFSMRTLDTVKNLSQSEAAAFQKILPLIARLGKDVFMTSNSTIYTKYGVSYGEIMLLDECGLITSDGFLSLNYEVTKDVPIAFCNKAHVILVDSCAEDPTPISIGVFKLTSAGRELYDILETESNYDYLVDFAADVFEDNKSTLRLTIHKMNWFDGKQISYKNQVLHEYSPK